MHSNPRLWRRLAYVTDREKPKKKRTAKATGKIVHFISKVRYMDYPILFRTFFFNRGKNIIRNTKGFIYIQDRGDRVLIMCRRPSGMGITFYSI